MTVREIVALGRLPHRRAFASPTEVDDAAVARAMARTDILHLAARAEPTLSSGERMRALLARALAVEAPWLLVDEPVTALDPAHQIDAMALLRRTAQDGTGVVAVLHDLTLASRFCDRIVVLTGGRLLADDTPEEALTDVLLARAFGVTAERGWASDGSRYILPWRGPGLRRRNAMTSPSQADAVTTLLREALADPAPPGASAASGPSPSSCAIPTRPRRRCRTGAWAVDRAGRHRARSQSRPASGGL